MNTQLTDPKKLKNARIAIISASIAIPLAVIALFFVKIENVNLNFLPQFYATINGITAYFLVLALIAIKRKNMIAAMNELKSRIAIMLKVGLSVTKTLMIR